MSYSPLGFRGSLAFGVSRMARLSASSGGILTIESAPLTNRSFRRRRLRAPSSHPIPQFDARVAAHAELAELRAAGEVEVAALALEEGRHVPAHRRDIRMHLAGSLVGRRIDELVSGLLG